MERCTLSEAKRAVSKLRRMTDAELAHTMRDLSDAICAALDMWRTDADPKMRQYAIELCAGQSIQAKRARIARAVQPSFPVDVSMEDGIRYPITVRVF